MKLINIGFGSLIADNRLVSVLSPDSAPVKRMIQDTRERGLLVDAELWKAHQIGYIHRLRLYISLRAHAGGHSGQGRGCG